jgi:hypothetical protein
MGYSVKKFDEKIEKLQNFLESCDDTESERYKKATLELRKCAQEKSDYCESVIDKAQKMFDVCDIESDQYREILTTFIPIMEDAEELASPGYYTEAVVAAALSVALDEAAKLTGNLTKFVPASTVGDVISMPAKKFIQARLKRYTLLFPDAVAFGQLEHEKYALDEVRKKFHVNMTYATKWQEKPCRVDVEVYFYNKKPVMLIAYTKDTGKLNMNSNLEVEFMDSKFRKHEDYYTACMATKIQLSHPSVMRLLTKMRKLWADQSKKMKEAVQESASEAELDGVLDEKIAYVTEAVDLGLIDKYVADNYTMELKRSLLRSTCE